MPILPSGLDLAVSSDALIETGTNWFKAPDGHFWFWKIDEELNPPPFELGATIFQEPATALAPKTRQEAMQFIRVLEMCENGKWGWRGEWLSSFPLYTKLDEQDTIAWNEWLARPGITRFIDETIRKCEKLAQIARNAAGYCVLSDAPSGKSS